MLLGFEPLSSSKYLSLSSKKVPNFSHPWDTVANAAWRKYPNPMNGAVSAIDVLKHESRNDGSLRSERIIQSHFPIPTWVTKVTFFYPNKYTSRFF